MDKKEIRSLTLDQLEIRSNDEGATTLSGYAARFNSMSSEMWGFREKIQQGAFKRSLEDGEKDIIALWNHDSNMPIGSTRSGTLKLVEDDIGLRFELTPIATSAGKDALEAVRSGVVKGVSFGFMVRGQVWDESDPENVVRTLTDVDLFEISPTPFPAYPATNVSARSGEDAFNDYKSEKEKREQENLKKIDIALKKLKLLEVEK